MSGHSKWSTIKHQKGVTDARRGQLFTKLSRDVVLAVRQGGGPDPGMNFRLRLAIDRAKSSNMPLDNIQRAIQRASGSGEGADDLAEIYYEGYGPGGAAILLQALTPNRNRTASEVRSTFTKAGASLGEAGCVAWNFESKGIITLEVSEEQAEEVALLAIDAQAEDVQVDGAYVEVQTRPEDLEAVRQSLVQADLPVLSAEISMAPKSTIALGDKEAEQTLKLLDNLEELMDVQKVYSNGDFSDEVLQRYSKES
jgi:YebC/PmpR family DNA-binding regulatory protein